MIFCMFALSCAAFGQQIKSKNVELDDLIASLNLIGYEFFSYDIREMLNEQYDIELIQKEYEAGKEIAISILNAVPNKELLTDYPESYWQTFMENGGRIIDPETKAIAHAEKISFGFCPANNDSTKVITINVSGIASNMSRPLKLRGLTMKNSDKKFFNYRTRPFKINAFKADEFIPLILFGSAWHNEQYDVFQFCGESEIDPDMSSAILKNVPHYYVVGVRFVKK